MPKFSRREAIAMGVFAAEIIRSSASIADVDNVPILDVPSNPPDPLSVPIAITVPVKKILGDKKVNTLTIIVGLKDPASKSFRLDLTGPLLTLDSIRIGARLKIVEEKVDDSGIDRDIMVSVSKIEGNPEVKPASKTVRITKATCAPPLISTLRASAQPNYATKEDLVTLKFMTPQPPLDEKNQPKWWVKMATISYRSTSASTDTDLVALTNIGRLLADELFLSFGLKFSEDGTVNFKCTTTDGTNDKKDAIMMTLPVAIKQ